MMIAISVKEESMNTRNSLTLGSSIIIGFILKESS